ncbi:DUF2157 domain-containing protein [Pedobacter sp. HMF7647]|uniref:DUF2157 domain-containing protein n=1 Tax=Hufsiella arboris TaxID=2695275 RepID=A0A7K1Y8U2_9SPHI|nr:DUF2157 domain-containing protein [Hufsiella arboris]MXV50791.1 DUF2157 domain-containing protein [Hufsiella arboris]
MAKLNLDKNEANFLDQTIKYWREENLLNGEQVQKLQDSYHVKGFDWKRLAQYSFWIALVCGIVAIASLIIDDTVIRWLKKLYDTPDIIIGILSGGVAAFLFYRGRLLQKHQPQKVFSNEAVVFLAVLFTANFIAFTGKAFDNGSGHFSILFLISVFIYGYLAYSFNSNLIWIFALISLGSWFGTETGYQTDWSYYFLGMNYPLRFVLFGALIVLFSFLMRQFKPLQGFHTLTYLVGMLYLFISLWLLSVFGNFGSIDEWLKIKQIHLFYWAIFSAFVAIGFTLFGLKTKDEIAREFGITFLLINIYTRYFEYFWDNTNKTIFFAILALSFWLIGRKAEKIWNLEFLKK